MSRRIAVVTDSTSDLTPAMQQQHGITVVALHVHFGQETFRDGVDLSADDFMRKMSSTDKLPTTSQPSVGMFEEAFRNLASTHDEIVCVLISSKLSGTIQSATLAAEAVSDVIPVEIVDSQNVAFALGLQAIRASELASSTGSAAEIAAIMTTEFDRYHIIFFVETLEHLRRGGRIGKAAQLLGSLLQLKPLLRVEEGQVVPFERTRTRSKAVAALVEFAKDMHGIDEAAVIYNTTLDEANGLARQIAPIAAVDEIQVLQFGPVISTHVGPGVLGIVLKEAARG
ncbi:MAG: DegV family protein [Thermomicrobiales bacterium]